MESTQSPSVKKREPNFELLRVIAMLMIITLHYNTHSDALLHLGVPASAVNIFANIMEAFVITGVNVYVLLSGFFLSKGKVKMSRIITLICQVYFYTLIISIVMAAVGASSGVKYDSLYKAVEYIFPISSEHYWFVTAYIIMYVLAPVMNAAVERLTRKQMKTVIFMLLTCFCFVKSVVPVLFPTDHFGYDYGWFICLYLIAAYVRKYNVVLFYNARNSALVFLISCAVIATMSISLYYINFNWGGFAHFQEVPFNLNFFFTLTGSLGLFSFFRFFRMRENRAADVVRFLGPLTFGVYLLHMHVEIRDRWVEWMEHLIGEVPMYSVPLFAWHAIRSIVIVFLAGIFVDWIRKMIFDYVGRVMHDTWLFKKVRQLDEELD
ncbi:acyltransferase [Butyrivibrio sp. XPD2006]|uniref:acyltransferase n=1 Tax=Butyrivibrio sp. XPD2006 TaxID=1280668 RepID=UPI0003B78AFC|nr:acyltransferase [Butyrivibrio sp. XPD2006]